MEKMILKGIRELAEFMGISTSTALKLSRREDFPVGRIGKSVLVPVPQLLDWLAAGGTEKKGGAA